MKPDATKTETTPLLERVRQILVDRAGWRMPLCKQVSDSLFIVLIGERTNNAWLSGLMILHDHQLNWELDEDGLSVSTRDYCTLEMATAFYMGLVAKHCREVES